MSRTPQDVYTAEEVARAAGVPIADVKALLASGEFRPIAGTAFFSAGDAVKAGRRLQHEWASAATAAARLIPSADPEPLFARVIAKSGFGDRRRGVHTAGSSAIHAVLLV